MEELKEVKELLKFVIEFIEAMDKSLADGKIDVADLANFLTCLGEAGPAVKDAKMAFAKLKVLTVEEIEELKVFIAAQLVLTKPEVEAVVEQAIAVAIDCFELMAKIKVMKLAK